MFRDFAGHSPSVCVYLSHIRHARRTTIRFLCYFAHALLFGYDLLLLNSPVIFSFGRRMNGKSWISIHEQPCSVIVLCCNCV